MYFEALWNTGGRLHETDTKTGFWCGGKTGAYLGFCVNIFSELTIQAVTERDNKVAHCHTPPSTASPISGRLTGLPATLLFTESSVGNTLRFCSNGGSRCLATRWHSSYRSLFRCPLDKRRTWQDSAS